MTKGPSIDPGTFALPSSVTQAAANGATTSVQGFVKLANHLGGTATAPTVRSASTSQTGISELTTGAEAVTGTDTARSMTADAHRDTWGLYYGVNAQTGTTYAPVLEDQGKLVTCTNAAAITVTMPSNATTAFPIGTQIDFAVLGAGMVTFVAGASATVNGTPSLVSRAQYSAVTLIKISTDGWLAVGDLA